MRKMNVLRYKNYLTKKAASINAAFFGAPGMGDNYRVRVPNAP
jgi:hypothetical protein